jgi:hypothetical protein
MDRLRRARGDGNVPDRSIDYEVRFTYRAD